MSDQTQFKHGGVSYPLTSSTTNALLKDADPALYYAIQLFSYAIKTYAGPRLLSQALLHDLRFPTAVEKTIHFEPTPYLLTDQLVFPLFCLYRSEEAWDEHTEAFGKDTATWEWAYILPPMTPTQIEALHPILRTVAVVMREFAARSWDPGFQSGATLCDLSGIQKMIPGPVRYGNFQPVDTLDKFWRAVTGKLIVRERDDVVAAAFSSFEGADVAIDHTSQDETVVADLVDGASWPAPTVTAINPATGTKQGGTSVTLTGTGFRVGTTPRVLIGGAYASSVVVASATSITCLTPAHDAYTTFAADVEVINADDQASDPLEAAFTFTTP